MTQYSAIYISYSLVNFSLKQVVQLIFQALREYTQDYKMEELNFSKANVINLDIFFLENLILIIGIRYLWHPGHWWEWRHLWRNWLPTPHDTHHDDNCRDQTLQPAQFCPQTSWQSCWFCICLLSMWDDSSSQRRIQS